MTSNSGGERFAAIPIRAMGDTRLSRADFRVLGAIAYFDRLGRNGYGCIVDPRRLAEIANVDYSHIARHTGRLKEFGYLAVGRSPSDRRKRIYRLIYNRKPEVIANAGDNSGAGADTGYREPEKIATGGDNRAGKVAKPKPHAIDPQAKSAPKRSCEAESRNPAKQGAHTASRSATKGRTRGVTTVARQGNTDRSTVPRQRELRVMEDVDRHQKREDRRDAAVRLNLRLSGNPDLLAKVMARSDSQELYGQAVDHEVERKEAGVRFLRAETNGERAA